MEIKMLNKLLNWIKTLFSCRHAEKTAEPLVKVEAVQFSIVLTSQLYSSLEKLESLTVTRSRTNSIVEIAALFADFKTVKLKCCKGSPSSKKFMNTTLTEVKKEKGRYILTLKIDK